jgi:hypothetical protein
VSIVAALIVMSNLADPTATWIGADDPHLRYTGRIGHEAPDVAAFYYSATSVKTKFSGRSLALRFEEDGWGPANSFGVRIDGSPEIIFQLKANTDRTYVVANGLSNRMHGVEIYRRQDAYGGVAKFKGLWIDKGARLDFPPKPYSKRIEVYGDSVTAGSATEAFGFEGQSDDKVSFNNEDGVLNNGYSSYAAIAARRLKAEAHIQGIGGLSLLDGTGWFGGPVENCKGLVTTWDKLNPLPGQYSNWDFNRFMPDVVVIAIGQNDARGGRIADPTWKAEWKRSYKQILDGLHAHYPKAPFVLTTTILMHDMAWDDALKEIAAEYKSAPVTYFGYRRAGKGTPGHPRLVEEEEMGQELADYLNRLPGIWGRPAR